jgi:hypothetical protein
LWIDELPGQFFCRKPNVVLRTCFEHLGAKPHSARDLRYFAFAVLTPRDTSLGAVVNYASHNAKGSHCGGQNPGILHRRRVENIYTLSANDHIRRAKRAEFRVIDCGACAILANS